MANRRERIGVICWGIAGIIFLLETLFGCFALLGIGFDTIKDVLLVFSLTLSLPIFLISFRNKTITLFALWIFFFAQWLDRCLLIGPPEFFNPVGDHYDQALLVGIILFTIAHVLVRKSFLEVS